MSSKAVIESSSEVRSCRRRGERRFLQQKIKDAMSRIAIGSNTANSIMPLVKPLLYVETGVAVAMTVGFVVAGVDSNPMHWPEK